MNTKFDTPHNHAHAERSACWSHIEAPLSQSMREQAMGLTGGNELLLFTVLTAALTYVVGKGLLRHPLQWQAAALYGEVGQDRASYIELVCHDNMSFKEALIAGRTAFATPLRETGLQQASVVMAGDIWIASAQVAAAIMPSTASVQISVDMARWSMSVRVNQASMPLEFAAQLTTRLETFLSRALYQLDAPIWKADQAALAGRMSFDDGTCATPAGEVHFQRQLHQICAQYQARTALSNDAVQLNYGELYEQVLRSATYLQSLGIVPGSRVGIMANRSPELIISILAVMCVGATYVPLDPEYPLPVLQDNLREATVSYVLLGADIGSELRAVLNPALPRVDLPTLDDPVSPDLPFVAPAGNHDRLAYIIFTSGSSGVRKAVGVSVASLVASSQARLAPYRGHSQGIKSMLISSISFDSSIGVIFGSIFLGENLYLPKPLAEKDPNLLLNDMVRQQVSSLLTLPSFVRVLLEYPHSTAAFSSMRRLILAGEKVNRTDLKLISSRFPQLAIFNEYGPTEGAVWASMAHLQAGSEVYQEVPIGSAVGHVRIYVMDDDLELVPFGVPGELCIAGSALAFGYVNSGRETAVRFLPDPYASVPGARLYRTGDMVAMAADRRLAYFGRLDRQVKIDGFRIELGEIENAALALPQVNACAAVVVIHGEQQQLEIFVLSVDNEVSLHAQLKATLPRHMLPAKIHHLDAIPLLPNGKYDYQSLSHQATSAVSATAEPLAADNAQLEVALTGIWCTVLRRNTIGRDDDFFDLGGSSIKAAMIVNRLQRLLNCTFYVGALFEQPTIAGLAQYLRQQFPTELIHADIH